MKISIKLVLTIIFHIVFSSTVIAIEDIQISKGVVKLMPIAINDFACNTHHDKNIASEILSIVEADLKHSGLFRFIQNSAFIENIIGINHKPHFASWRQINANFILNGQIQIQNLAELSVKVILWDSINEKVIFAQNFNAPIRLSRQLAHQISDMIYQALTGDPGYFNTKIFYVSEALQGKNKTARLAEIDYDGKNHRFLTNGRFQVLTPSASPNGQHLLYVSYEKTIPQIFVQDLKTLRRYLLGNFSAMSFAPKFSPDGSKIIFSIAKKGVTNIFTLDLTTNTLRQLTSGIAINTSPTYSPDGKTIYFHSDRSGSGQIYSMDADGYKLQRISFGEGSYSAPSCSPNGKYIVFTKKIRNQDFALGVMRSDGSDERIITSGFMVEGATWSPNSRNIAFARTTASGKKAPSSTKLYTIDISGFNERVIPTPFEASDPEWSWRN